MNILFHPKLPQVIENIKKVRDFRNFSQDYVATCLGISQNAFSKIELGYTNVTLSRVLHIADVLEVDIIDFFNLDLTQLSAINYRRAIRDSN